MLAAKKTNQPEQKAIEPTGQKFSKSQLIRCGRYHDRRDLVDALLDDSEKYTTAQVDKMIENFMKGKVK